MRGVSAASDFYKLRQVHILRQYIEDTGRFLRILFHRAISETYIFTSAVATSKNVGFRDHEVDKMRSYAKLKQQERSDNLNIRSSLSQNMKFGS